VTGYCAATAFCDHFHFITTEFTLIFILNQIRIFFLLVRVIGVIIEHVLLMIIF